VKIGVLKLTPIGITPLVPHFSLLANHFGFAPLNKRTYSTVNCYCFKYFLSRMILVNTATSPAVLNAPTNVAMNISMIFLFGCGINEVKEMLLYKPDRF